MTHRAPALAVVLALIFSGCLSDGPDAPANSTTPSPTTPGLVLADPPGGPEDPAVTALRGWHDVGLLATAEGTVQAYEWKVPPEPDPRVTGPEQRIRFELAPHLPTDSAITEWAFLVFGLSPEGRLERLGATSSAATQVRTGFAARATTEAKAPDPRPRLLSLLGIHEEDDTLLLVLAARSHTPTSFRFAFRPVDGSPGATIQVSASHEAFLAAVGPNPAKPLTVRGSGTGFQTDAYLEELANVCDGRLHWRETQTRNVRLDARVHAPLEPIASARDQTVTIQSDRPAGYTESAIQYYAHASAARLEVTLRARTHALDTADHKVQAPVAGLPLAAWSAVGDGPGPSRTQVRILGAHVDSGNAFLAYMYVRHLELGIALADLLGHELAQSGIVGPRGAPDADPGMPATYRPAAPGVAACAGAGRVHDETGNA